MEFTLISANRSVLVYPELFNLLALLMGASKSFMPNPFFNKIAPVIIDDLPIPILQ